MKKADLLRKIEALEARVAALEAQPRIYYTPALPAPLYPPPPYYPNPVWYSTPTVVGDTASPTHITCGVRQ